ncbi:MAG TPA: thiamine phosphate synthase, partial [Candidatus Berkiella sp.]|nr:thiamine phosphate synthase [Candidatus Berkiella sp.]
AIKHKAYGVHLGQEDIHHCDINAIKEAGLRLGISTHSLSELARAKSVQPSYIAFGPIFPTTTKVMTFPAQGLIKLKQWRKWVNEPLVAIGGITTVNL